MTRLFERPRRPLRSASILGSLFVVEMIVASCAGPGTDEDDLGRSANESDGGVSIDASDATCEVDSDSCANRQQFVCDGFEWCVAETGHPIEIGLSSIWGSGPTDVWVVGAAGRAIHWNGDAWTPAPVATDRALQAIWGTGPDDVWTVSSPSKIFHTRGISDGSAQWSSVAAIWDAWDLQYATGIMRAVWGASPTDVWVGGSAEIERPGSTLVEYAWRSSVTDTGLTWVPVLTAPDSSLHYYIRSIWGSGLDDIWMVGSKQSESQPWLPFAAHTNAGAPAGGGAPAWTEFDTQSRSALYAIWGSGPRDVWAVGDYGMILHFGAGADAWSIVDSPTSENLRGIWGMGPTDIWAVGMHGTILHYDGVAWRTSTGAFPLGEKPDLYGVWGSGSSDVWAVGSGVVMHFSGNVR